MLLRRLASRRAQHGQSTESTARSEHGEHSTVRKEVGGGDGKGVRARTGTPAALSPDHRWVVRLFTFLCPRKVQV